MAAFQVVGALSSAKSASDSAASQAAADRANAQIANNNANNSLLAANANEEAQRRRNAMMLGDTAAGIASSGLTNSGSAAAIYQQNALGAEMDALNIRYGGQVQATNFKNQANQDEYQASVQDTNAQNARLAGYINAGAAALSGYGGYVQNQQIGELRKAQMNYYSAGRPGATSGNY
jgi:hypothetical protein